MFACFGQWFKCVILVPFVLVMMYHETNLDRKSFNISEDLVDTIVAMTLNIAK